MGDNKEFNVGKFMKVMVGGCLPRGGVCQGVSAGGCRPGGLPKGRGVSAYWGSAQEGGVHHPPSCEQNRRQV